MHQKLPFRRDADVALEGPWGGVTEATQGFHLEALLLFTWWHLTLPPYWCVLNQV